MIKNSFLSQFNGCRSKVIGVVVITGVVASLVVFKCKMGCFYKSPPKSESERLSRLASTDRASLFKKDATDVDVFSALVRLAQQQIPEARQEAIRRSTGPSVILRGGAANALGYFEDSESLAVLKKLLNDPDNSVRTQAVFALARVPTDEKENLLRELLLQEKLPPEIKMAGYANLFYFKNSKHPKSQIVQKIIEQIKQTDNLNLKLQGVNALVQSAPDDPKVSELLRSILSDSKLDGLAPIALNQLFNSNPKDPWLKKHLSTLLISKTSGVRLAAIQYLHSACVPERWKYLQGVLRSETDQNIRLAAIREARAMPGADAVHLLRSSLESGMLRDSETESVKAALVELKQPGALDPCHAASK